MSMLTRFKQIIFPIEREWRQRKPFVIASSGLLFFSLVMAEALKVYRGKTFISLNQEETKGKGEGSEMKRSGNKGQ